MDWVMFAFLVIFNLAMIGIAGVCYGKKDRITDGMLLGVRVPDNAAEDEETMTLLQEYKTRFRRYQRINICLGILLSALWFLSVGICMLVWVLWLLAYFLLLMAGMMRYHRRMYEIKISQDWVTEGTDDNIYWKNGWYSNPKDPHLFVRDRFSKSNFTLNMAHPSAKWWIGALGGILILSVVVCVIVAVMLYDLDHSSVQMEVSGNSVEVSCSFYDCSLSVEDIRSVKLRKKLPDEKFVRTNGSGTEEMMIGHYKGKLSGKTMMFLHRNVTPLIEIRTDQQTIYFNSDNSSMTQQRYHELSMLLSRSACLSEKINFGLLNNM